MFPSLVESSSGTNLVQKYSWNRLVDEFLSIVVSKMKVFSFTEKNITIKKVFYYFRFCIFKKFLIDTVNSSLEGMCFLCCGNSGSRTFWLVSQIIFYNNWVVCSWNLVFEHFMIKIFGHPALNTQKQFMEIHNRLYLGHSKACWLFKIS